MTRVWDVWQRLGHWILAAAFVVAYVSEGEPEELHEIAGYVVGAYVVLRILWGFVGSPHARFAGFVRGPRAVFAYLAGLLRGTAPRHLGHNPAGGAMVIALLLSLSATVGSGLALLADEENEGPLAPWLGHPETPAAATVAEDEDGEGDERESVYEELHETLANLTLALVLVHLLGVLASSWAHRENLPLAMITGNKRSAAEPTSQPEVGHEPVPPPPRRP